MPKEEWGTKRICPTTGKRFYDLNQTPIISPYTGDTVEIDAGNKSRVLVADKADAKSTESEANAKDSDVTEGGEVLDDDDVDVDLGDDVLDDDDDDDVSLDDIADVAADDSDD
jgi:uncharacterized protein (TIGR02300 family)